jgi:outer membrane protein
MAGFRAISMRHAALGLAAMVLLVASPCRAETMSGALARAYTGNPDLNQRRAGVRATDETLPRAASTWRPSVRATGDVGYNYLDFNPGGSTFTGTSRRQRAGTLPRAVGLSVTQNIFNGNRTLNGVRQAESNILGAREDLRETELDVLQSGANAYMDVLLNIAILDLRKNNITVLEQQLRQTRDRFDVGEVTRTDVAQAQSQLATGRSDYFRAQAELQTSIATYRRVIGVEPTKLEPARSIESLLPRGLDRAVRLALDAHPGVQAALHAVDAAELQVKLVEGELYPTVNVVGSVDQTFAQQGFPRWRQFDTSIVGQVSIPIYASGGETYARVRQAKELLGQTRLQADLRRDEVRATVVSTWGQLETARAVIQSSRAAVKASEIALEGIREEAKVGQRTTFDVLFAQQTLLDARVRLVTAQRDQVVASYAVMAAIGLLSVANLHLDVERYDPTIHFDQVKDQWIGLRTPDGR